MTDPIDSGRKRNCRVGPTGKRRFCTAHATYGPLAQRKTATEAAVIVVKKASDIF
jgi:hypothetical protein